MTDFIELLFHVDRYLLSLIATYGAWIYVVLFVVVFTETGLILTPFLPGDSLLFAAGTMGATGALDARLVGLLLLAAAISGDAVNYAAGRAVGTRMIRASLTDERWQRWVNPAHLARAHEFFKRHGGKAVVLARFIPILRTFVPFVAGAVQMSYPSFAFYNVAGATAWVGVCVGAGYLFGNVAIVKENFTLVVLGIVAVSLLPMFIEYLRYRARNAASR